MTILVIYLLIGVFKTIKDFILGSFDSPHVPMYASGKKQYWYIPIVILFWPIITLQNRRF